MSASREVRCESAAVATRGGWIAAIALCAAWTLGCPAEEGPSAQDASLLDEAGRPIDASVADGAPALVDGGGTEPGACEALSSERCGCASADEVGARRCAADGSGWSSCECERYGIAIAVSPSGSDDAAGTLEAPYRTLARAKARLAELVAAGLPEGGAVVWLRAGTYALDAPLVLGAAESGTAERPVVVRGYPGEVARISGGAALEPSAFHPVSSDDPLYDRLPAEARDAVRAISLRDAGITDLGELTSRGFQGEAARGPLELFVGGRAMTLARWPDAGENTFQTDLEAADAIDLHGETTPSVAGHYVKTGTSDGVSAFTRDGLVDGHAYHLYRHTWTYEGSRYTAWFLTTAESGYPSSSAGPGFYRYDARLGPLEAGGGAVGSVLVQDPAGINHGFAQVASATDGRTFRYAGDRPSRWADVGEVWFHGFWRYAWADQHLRAAAIDTGSRTVTLASPSGYGIAAGQPFYAYNIPEELTEPGEYYVERASGTLYLWPPPGFAEADVSVSMVNEALVQLDGARFVTLQDLTLELGRGRLVELRAGEHDRLVGLTLENAGTSAARITGHDHLVRACRIRGTGNGGVIADAGTRRTLTAGNVVIEQSDFRDLSRWEWTYRPAVRLAGHGNVVRHNRMSELPHSAIYYTGSGHLIELNEIDHVCRYSSDAGAIYGGRDWGARGIVIRHNFIHDLRTFFDGYGVQGIYLDDCLSGVRVDGNVLYRIADYGIQHGGGRDTIMVGNVIARSGGALVADRRCATSLDRGVPNDTPGDGWNLLEKLRDVGYQEEPWASTYPECAAIPDDWAAISSPPSHWLEPEGSVYSRNVSWENDTSVTGTPETFAAYAERADDLDGVDPRFVDEASLDLALSPDSPALALPGWEPIPFSEIGIRP